MVQADFCRILRSYAQDSIKEMSKFIDESGIYKDFPTTRIKVIRGDIGGSCLGGAIYSRNKPVPYVEINSVTIVGYIIEGFREYDHIKDDKEIGSIAPVNWRHCMAVVICHELSHAVRMMQQIKDIAFRVPRTYNSYPVSDIAVEYAQERRNHGRQWQYIYRHLRNEFVNSKERDFWG